jgi:hypothetical protein
MSRPRLRASLLFRAIVLVVCAGLFILTLTLSDSIILFYLVVSIAIDAIAWLLDFRFGLWAALVDGLMATHISKSGSPWKSLWFVEDRRWP